MEKGPRELHISDLDSPETSCASLPLPPPHNAPLIKFCTTIYWTISVSCDFPGEDTRHRAPKKQSHPSLSQGLSVHWGHVQEHGLEIACRSPGDSQAAPVWVTESNIARGACTASRYAHRSLLFSSNCLLHIEPHRWTLEDSGFLSPLSFNFLSPVSPFLPRGSASTWKNSSTTLRCPLCGPSPSLLRLPLMISLDGPGDGFEQISQIEKQKADKQKPWRDMKKATE